MMPNKFMYGFIEHSRDQYLSDRNVLLAIAPALSTTLDASFYNRLQRGTEQLSFTGMPLIRPNIIQHLHKSRHRYQFA